jgi:hypothetical protein
MDPHPTTTAVSSGEYGLEREVLVHVKAIRAR